MKQNYFLFGASWLVCLLLLATGTRAQNWQSVLGVTNTSQVTANIIDANGTVYVAGTFSGTVTFGSTTLSSLNNGYAANIFVAKRQGTGYAWAVQAGGSGIDVPTALVINGNNLYVGGTLHYSSGNSTSVTFGGINLTNTNGASNTGFVAKLALTGSVPTWTWAQAVRDSESATVEALAVSGSSVYAVGTFSYNTVRLGPLSLNNSDPNTALLGPSSDVFVAKLSDAGSSSTWTWAVKAGGRGNESARGVAVRGNSVYVVGSTDYNASFGSTTLYTAGAFDAFVAKLTDAGSSASWTWAQSAGGANGDEANSLALGAGSTLYVVGYFNRPYYGYVMGSPGVFGTASVMSAGAGDMFVAKYTDAGSQGSVAWVQAAGGPDNESATDVAVNGSSLYVTGTYQSATASFGSAMLTNARTATTYTTDLFVTRLTDLGPTGRFEWAQRAGGPQDDNAFSVAVSGSTVHLTGMVSPPAVFGTFTLSTSISSQLGFVATLTDLTPAATATARVAGLALVPNPAHHAATLQLPAGLGSTTLTLLDAQGRTVRTQPVSSSVAELNLTGLAPGLYQVRVQAGGQQLSQRLVVE